MAISSISGKRAPKASAEDSSAFGAIAERFRRAGELERAVNLCRDGLQKFPDQVSARVTLGWALLELGKYDEAREELEQVLRRRPDNLAAIRALAELHDRSEQTLNLPMDGPGQWPPSEEVVDQAATNVADPVMTFSSDGMDEPVLIHSPAQEFADLVAATPLRDAVIAPPALGLAMWSAMPEPEPEKAPEPSFGFMLNDRTAALAAAVAIPVQEASLPEVDLAALIAEADSLEAAADADAEDILVEPPMMVLESAEAEPAADLCADTGPVFAIPGAHTLAAYAQGASDYEVEAESYEPAVFQFQSTEPATFVVPQAAAFVQPEELTAGGTEPELVAPIAAQAVEPAVAFVAEAAEEFVAPSFLASDAVTGEFTPSHIETPEELVAFAPAEELVAVTPAEEPVEQLVAFVPVEEPVEELVAFAPVEEPVEELVAFAPVVPVEELVAFDPVEEVAAFTSLEEPAAYALVEEPVVFAAVDTEPAVEAIAGPRFELAPQSISEIESAPMLMVGDETANAEAVELGHVSIDQSALDFETVVVEPMARAEVTAEVRQFREPMVPAAASPVRALEGFLAQVQARRQHLMAESVA